jgi:hypothetical protein
MSTLTVRLSESSHRLLRDLTEQTGQTTMEVLDRALDTYRRSLFDDPLAVSSSSPQTDSDPWAEVEPGRKLWDATLESGLDPCEYRPGAARDRDFGEDRNLSRSALP